MRASLGIRARRFLLKLVMFSIMNKNFGTCNTLAIYVL